MLRALSLLSVLAATSSAFAASPRSPEPSVRKAPAESSGLERASDPRLDQRVTLKLAKRPLAEVAAELSRKTGTTITVAPPLADEPGVVYVAGRPAREVMAHLARLFRGKWEVAGAAGKQKYRLLQPLHAAREGQALVQADRERMWAALRAEMTKQLAGPASAPAPLLRFAMDLPSASYHRLMEGEPLYFSTAEVPGAIRLSDKAAQQLYPGEPEFAETARNLRGFHIGIWCDVPGNYRPLRLTFRRVALRPLDDRPAPVDLGSWNVDFSYRRPTPPPVPDAQLAARWSADPVLGAKRPLDPTAVPTVPGAPPLRLHDFLAVVAESYPLNLVADAYWLTAEIARLPQGEQPLYELLARYVHPYARWEKDGEFLLLRSHTWYHDRLVEIPARTLDPWCQRLRVQGRLSLDDAAALAASLSNEQLDYFDQIIRQKGLGADCYYMCMNEGGKEVLRLYASLTPAQRQVLLRGEPLDYSRLPGEARRWLRAAYAVRQKIFPFHAPPGGPTWGELAFSLDRIERVVNEADERRLMVQFRVLEGPDTGKLIGGGPIGTKYSNPLSATNVISERLHLRHLYDRTHSAPFTYPLPTVYVYPEPRLKVAPPNPGTN